MLPLELAEEFAQKSGPLRRAARRSHRLVWAEACEAQSIPMFDTPAGVIPKEGVEAEFAGSRRRVRVAPCHPRCLCQGTAFIPMP